MGKHRHSSYRPGFVCNHCGRTFGTLRRMKKHVCVYKQLGYLEALEKMENAVKKA